MKKLFIRLSLLFLPLLIMVVFFIVVDPMKVIHHYDNPLEIGVLMNDRHYQAGYLSHNKIPYQSFICGSSRSKMFKIPHWQQYLGADTICFHLGVNDESLWGIMKKLQYIDQQGYAIRHCLITMDYRLLRDIENNDAHIFRDHPMVSGETYPEYYKFFFIAFITPEFLKSYIDWLKTHTYKPEMQNYIWKEHYTYDKRTGDIYYTEYDSLLQLSEAKYYEGIKDVFYKRDTTLVKLKVKDVLTDRTRGHLLAIKTLFDKHRTDYRIIITPNYDQVALSDSDYHTIQKIFEPKYITNLSGINPITENARNFYEAKHFRPFIADTLMHITYSTTQP